MHQLVFKTSSTRLHQNNLRLPRRLEDIFKTSSRRLGRRKIATLRTHSRRLEDMS